eukprot:TRINITY_DN1782_c4_g1_i1.p1 TRINITY_DN1782_c4_g1~~TRINITY_DN1782_c4_g1_i1.p1  ORF type:complete len:198 (+),score=49.15 TRINITY_DN1782_c4_g1_i1:230-823(+)
MAQRHPLEYEWTLWFDSKKTAVEGKSWEENLQHVADFATVEDFWSMYNHIKRPGSLEFGSNYHAFKGGIKPMWEDPANKSGGRWVINLQGREDPDRVNEIWEHLLLSMIGEFLEDGVEPIAGGHVTGAVLGRRKAQVKLAVWTRDSPKLGADSKAALEVLGKRLRDVLKLREDTQLHFIDHEEHEMQGWGSKPALVA